MDEFARMMSKEGVRPLARPKDKTLRAAKKQRSSTSLDVVATLEPGFAPSSVGYAWVDGPRARLTLDTALERLATETRDGRGGWATGIRQDGVAITLPASSGAASLLGVADRQSLRLMIVGGDGWTFVMHPLMGVATLDEDPVTSG